MREKLFELTNVLRDNPNTVVQERVVNQLSELLEKEYVKGVKMAQSLLRLKLGLGTKEDEY